MSPDLTDMANGCPHQSSRPLPFVASAFPLRISLLAGVRRLMLNYLLHFHLQYRYYSSLCLRGQAVQVLVVVVPLTVLVAFPFPESGEHPQSAVHWVRLLLFLLWVPTDH